MALSHVAIIRWPEEAAVATWLRAQGRPRLLLVAADADAPRGSDWNEDWIRLPARDDDVHARAAALESRSVRRGPGPEVNGDGRLCYEGRWVPLSHTEEVMVRVLSRRFGEVVDADSLASAFGGRRLSPTAVRVHLTRLRKRIVPIGLVVRTVRGRGYVLDAASFDGPVALSIPPPTPDPRPDGQVSVALSMASRKDGQDRRADGGAERSRTSDRRRLAKSQQHDQNEGVLVVGDLVVDGPRHRVSVGERRIDLTPTEFRFLSLLARQPGELVPYKVIVEQLWGDEASDNQYLRVYVAQIRKKLEDDPARPRLITKRRLGYRLIDPLENTP